MKEMLSVTRELFSDLSGFASMKKSCESLCSELKSSKNDQFSDWSHDVLSQIDDTQHPLWFICKGLIVVFVVWFVFCGYLASPSLEPLVNSKINIQHWSCWYYFHYITFHLRVHQLISPIFCVERMFNHQLFNYPNL